MLLLTLALLCCLAYAGEPPEAPQEAQQQPEQKAQQVEQQQLPQSGVGAVDALPAIVAPTASGAESAGAAAATTAKSTAASEASALDAEKSAASPRLRGSVASSGLESAAEFQAPCSDKEKCLGLIDSFLAGTPHETGLSNGGSLLQTFGSALPGGGGSCGQLCNLKPKCEGSVCRYDVYDNAVAAIYLTKRGRLEEARKILDALTELLYHDHGQLSLLYAAYTSTGQPLDFGVDVGNNAWVGMAYAHFAAATGEACIAAIGRAVLRKIADEAKCDDHLGGYMGRLPRGKGNYRATEHNIDMYALAQMFGEKDLQARAGKFVSSMFGFDGGFPNTYATSTRGEWICDSRQPQGLAIAADAQFWNLLSGADNDSARKRSSLEFALRASADGGFFEQDVDVLGDGTRLSGVRFTDRGRGAQWENTASAVMGLGFFDAVFGDKGADSISGEKLFSMRSSLLHQLEEYGSVLASVRGGNLEAYEKHSQDPNYPGGSDTGIGWTYLRYPHMAATAWTGLMMLEANPFAPPEKPVPSADTPLDGRCPASWH